MSFASIGTILLLVDKDGHAIFKIRKCEDIRDPDWLALRSAFWDGESEEEHFASLQKFKTTHAPYLAFIANGKNCESLGFAETSVRRDYVNGCESSPVLYLEGIFVRPEIRGTGIAHALCRAAEDWGAAEGIREFASDSDVENVVSINAHRGLGFQEIERVVCFRKLIGR